ncbi:plasmodesmata-located protein 3-like [Diospyros lotus]|uniref:plasmodesmata-located protein 3-like n=1 Tax=Diospyros lotus TaxID=55363 RepID=UPI002254E727|nr:plasmodesmata-located protein 3-like [Diospyros lotus]
MALSLPLPPSPLLFPSLLPFSSSFVIVFFPFLISASSSDYSKLVFKGCSNQKLQDPTGAFSQSLKTLFSTLQSQSSASKFNKTTADSGGQAAVVGLFQCRGDLSGSDCNKCVAKLPAMAQKLCGPTIAARVQVGGCYMRYEVAGFKESAAEELLYKVCGSRKASGSGFGDRLETALGEIEKGVGSGNTGFYTGSYESVYVLGQCEGDLGTGDCVECVKSAVERAKSECGNSISGQVYLYLCYISYSYYPNGVPLPGSSNSLSGRTGRNAQKTVAIVVGGVAGFGILIAFLLVLKSAFKKKEVKFYAG